MDDMSEGLLEDCAQLVKANSIQGCINYKETILSQIMALYFLVKTVEYYTSCSVAHVTIILVQVIKSITLM